MADDESIRVLEAPIEGRLSDLLRGPVAPGIRRGSEAINGQCGKHKQTVNPPIGGIVFFFYGSFMVVLGWFFHLGLPHHTSKRFFRRLVRENEATLRNVRVTRVGRHKRVFGADTVDGPAKSCTS